ncbi:hypothetical protein GWI33_006835 [Rhynchophorus ferrugineus]|uniref:Secreted protein n=1 Tax=Rhynchophorus ferrugineus TaxID=354439 RepID=A0A834ITU1_RHYFE|nr:hypothetical protein GWI33_006835 [Rhynchophorus ferrugineus]
MGGHPFLICLLVLSRNLVVAFLPTEKKAFEIKRSRVRSRDRKPRAAPKDLKSSDKSRDRKRFQVREKSRADFKSKCRVRRSEVADADKKRF